MKLLGIIDEDFVNYKKVCMTLEFPFCSFKCNKEFGSEICQNSELKYAKLLDIDAASVISRYQSNDITEAVCMQGLEPFDSYDELLEFIYYFREVCDDDIVIYTGYYEDEIFDKLIILQSFKNIIVKFGRFIPNQTKHFDEVLGVYLMSDNQYSKYI